MIRIQQRLLSFSIVSHKIAHNAKDYARDSTLNFYPVVGLKDIKLGTISLNQPNNQNFLTEEMMGEIFRFLNSYHHDHTVENIWIQNRGSMFLGGLSYQQLANNPEYLDKLYKMIVMVAKLNKPVFSLVTGGVRNVGAYVLSMAAVALTDHTSTLRFDEVSKGFIPVAGGSHRLSRLPVNVGYFLALTGKRLTSDQMARLGFITGTAKEGANSKHMRSVITKSNLFFRDKVRYNTFDKRDNQFDEWRKILKKQKDFKMEAELNQVDILNSNQNVFAKFAMNQYRLAQFNYQNTVNPYNSFSDKPGREINNYFVMRHHKAIEALKRQGLIETAKFDDVRLPGFDIEKILKVFRRDSIAEVINALEADESDWGRETLRHLRQMDPLAATLTFELLKRAETLSWDQCLDIEYTVAKRLLANSKLQLKQTYGGSKFILTNQYSQGKIEDIPLESVIEEYFSPAMTEEETLQREVPLYSLLPNKNYIDIPDSARLALNQQFFDDIHLTNQQVQMKRWLQNEKINYRHKSYNIHLLRQKIHEKEEYDLVKSNQSKRLQYIINNSRVLNNFIDERINLIDKMTNQELDKFLDDMITKVFNNGIQSRFQEFKKTAAIIGKERKLQIFRNLRKTLVKKIVLNGVEVQQDNIDRQDIFKGPIYFDQKNKSIYETRNPYLKVHEPLDKLAEQIAEKGQISQEFKQNQGALPVDRNLGMGVEITKRENYLKRVGEKVAKRYAELPEVWSKAYQYQEMVREAAKTSEEIAQYLEWGAVDFYNTILNAPSTPKTYAQYGQQVVESMQSERQATKKAFLTEQVLYQVYSKQFYDQVYTTKPNTTYKPTDYIKQQLIPKFALNKEIEKFMGPILEQVLKHFQQKYFSQALQQKKLEFGEFDQYIYQGQDKDFVQFYKNDILFVYSYFAILKVKEVLHNLKLNGVSENQEELLAFFRQYNIEFLPDRSVAFMNKILSKFLFQMLDLHTYTKAKVQLPQNKLLDFLNRTKISRETQKRSLYPLSFESLLLMIGKDRSKLYSKVVRQFIPSEPQYLLEMANNNTKDQLNEEAKGSIASNLYLYENNVTDEHLQKKRLISGYQYYLGLFDSFIHRAGGKFNFINDHILSLDSKLLKQQMEEIINLKETPQQWFQRCAEEAVKKFFNGRLQFEKNLTKGELLALDQEMKEVLTPDGFRMVMKFILQSEIQQTKVYFSNTRNYSYSQTESERHQERYCDIRRSVKNPDAFKRLNNLNLAMKVQKEYYADSQKRKTMEQEKQDLVEEKKEFQNYERFPRETYRRMNNEVFNYGQEKNFDKYLNPINERHMDHKTYVRKLHFSDDDKLLVKKEEKYTDFDEEIKLLRNTITKNSTEQETDSIYKKLEELL